eukprot:m.144470 g.144470  ORF g.144470 m.144470 type:complete len:392 (-) comp14131_c1_seq1:864-2039(-)
MAESRCGSGSCCTVNRWVTAAWGMLIMFISGTIYLFPSYSDSLRLQLGYSVSQVDTVGTLLNFGTWMSILGGFVYDRYGPKVTGYGGTSMILLGYLLMYAAARGAISASYIAMGVFTFILGQGSGWMYSVALNTSIANFSSADRGKLVGMLVCCFGLCSGVFSQFHTGFFGNDSTVNSFLLFLALVTSSIGFVGTALTNFVGRQPAKHDPPPASPWRLRAGYLIAVLIALYMASASLIETFLDAPPSLALTATLAVLMTAPLLLIVRTAPYCVGMSSTHGVGEGDQDMATSLLEPVNSEPLISTEPSREEQYTFLQTCKSLDFWLLFLLFLGAIGSGWCSTKVAVSTIVVANVYLTVVCMGMHVVQWRVHFVTIIRAFRAFFSGVSMLYHC